jgi:alpha/beta hydrolase family protein
VLGRVDTLARVVAVVADGFARTEAGVAASFAFGPPWPRLDQLFTGMPPAALEALLVGSPELARIAVDRMHRLDVLGPGSVAAQLYAVQRSGEPTTVVLRQSRAILLALSDDDRRRLALLHPALVSGVASAPVEDRLAACRVLVSAEIARLRTSFAGQMPALVERRLRRYDELLHGRVVLARPDGTRLVRPHQLLAFDPGGDGRIAEVFGDLSSASHLAVYVPGTGTSLDRYDGNARRVTDFAAADPSLAVVLWQNADFPDQPQDYLIPPIGLGENPVHAVQHQLRGHVLAAAYRDAADVAGVALTRDVEGLRMAAPRPGADLTVLGHSYGGSIVGSAEAHGLRVERVVQIASAGAYVDDVRAYTAGECGTRRFSMTAPDDPIQLVQGAGFRSRDEIEHSLRTVVDVLPLPLKPLAPAVTLGVAVASADPLQIGHGLDPDLVPGVTRLDTGVRPDGHTLVSGHGGMFEPGSTAWRNLLAVMRGDPVESSTNRLCTPPTSW